MSVTLRYILIGGGDLPSDILRYNAYKIVICEKRKEKRKSLKGYGMVTE